MKLSITRSTLADALATVAPTVAKRSTLPVLSHVRIEAAGDNLQLSTTDMDSYTQVGVTADIEAGGSVCVPHALLQQLVNSVSAATLALSLKGTTLNVAGAGVNSNIKGLDADDFPRLDTEADAQRITVDGDELAAAANVVLHAVSKDASRHILASVSLKAAAGVLTMATTDGYRLSVSECPVSDASAQIDALVMPHILREVARSGSGAIQMDVSETKAVFRCDNVVYSSQLVNGNYPEYAAIIPKSHTSKITVNRAELQQAVRTAFLFARDKANIVTFCAEPDVLRMEAHGEDGETKIELPCTLEGEPMGEYRLNAQYVLDMLSALSGDTVTVDLTMPTRPGLWQGNRPGAFCVVMPMAPPR